MAFEIPRNPTLIESLTQGFGLAAPGLIANAQRNTANQQFQQSLAGLTGAQPGIGQFNQLAQFTGLPQQQVPVGQAQFNQFSGITDPAARQAILGGLLQQGFNPLQNQQREANLALTKAQTTKALTPTVRQPTAFQEKQDRIKELSAIEKKTPEQQAELNDLLNVPVQPQRKQSESVILDPDDPTRAIRVRNTFDKDGNITNQIKIGEATLAEKIGGVASEGLEKSTRGKLEKDIIDLSQTLTELGSLQGRMEPDAFGGDFTFEDFFTVPGRVNAKITDIATQLKIPRSEAAKKFLTAKATFGADAKRVFLKFRKFITGVAGGAKEFDEIRKASIDPEKGSSITFKARFESMRDSALRTQNMLLAMRNSGLDPNSAKDRRIAFSGKSINDIPLEVSPDVTIDTLNQLNAGSLVPVKDLSDEELLREIGGQ
jgi:hypothetical protein